MNTLRECMKKKLLHVILSREAAKNLWPAQKISNGMRDSSLPAGAQNDIFSMIIN
jgi:hypothetical protein